MLFIFFFVFPLTALSSGSVPQLCNKIFVSRFEDYYSIGNLTVSAELELILVFNGTKIIVSNVFVEGNLNLGNPDYVCANVDFEQTFPTAEFCSSSLNETFNFITQKPAFDIQIYFSNPSYFYLFYGFADNGSFSLKNGTLFSSTNPSFTEYDVQSNYYDILTQTCTSFIPAPIAPTTNVTTKCKKFKSQILILNTTDNYSIFASSYMEWFLSNDKFEGDGNSTIPGAFDYFDYIFNDVEDECFYAGCSYKLQPGDKKLIISANTDKRHGFDLIVYPIPMVGRTIFRDNQILMAEGIPFSPKDDCLYFNFPYSSDQVSTNKFCCIEFEDS